MAKWLPKRQFQFLGYKFSFNPGPFNQKEHMLITVMANVGLLNIYSTHIFEVQILKMFFDQPWARNKAYQYCIAVSMQCLGYGIAGLIRASIVFPEFCIYPYNLATIILNRTLHESESGWVFRVLGSPFPRFRYFLVLSGVYFIYHMFHISCRILILRLGPGYLFAGSIENFNWMTWINPGSKVLALITGGTNGLGLNPIPTLDWTRIGGLLDVQPNE
jgi:OPT oligopeptide transporter protein